MKKLTIILIAILGTFIIIGTVQAQYWALWRLGAGSTIHTTIPNLNMDLGSGDITTTGLITADSLSANEIFLGDNNYLYFDDAKINSLRYSSGHDAIVVGGLNGNGVLVGVADMGIAAATGVDGNGNWEPNFTLYNSGIATVTNTSQGDAGNKYFKVNMTDGLRLRTGGAAADAIILADNMTDPQKTFQFPDIGGTLVTTSGALANIDIGAYSFEADTITQAGIGIYNQLEILELIAGGNFDYFLNDTASGVDSYYTMDTTPTGEVESVFEDEVESDDFLMFSFITPADEPTFTTISAGVFSLHYHGDVDSVSESIDTIRIYYKLYEYDSAAAETLIATSEMSDVLTEDKTGYNIHSIHDEITIEEDDRFLIKIYAKIDDNNATNADVNLYVEGTNATRFSVMTNIGVFDARYFNLDAEGTNITNGTFDLTTDGLGTFGYVNITDEANGYQIDGGTILTNEGTRNLLIGAGAGSHDVGEDNVFIGHLAGYRNDTTGGAAGNKNTYIGKSSGYGNTTDTYNTGYSNVGLGYETLFNNTTGYYNMAIGYRALAENEDGVNNVAVGSYSLAANVSGIRNTGVGNVSLGYLIDGNYNVAIGYGAVRLGNIGDKNVAIGAYSLEDVTGSNNVVIGYEAGKDITSGLSNVFIGYNAGYGLTTDSNKLIIQNDSDSASILISGDFLTNELTINGDLIVTGTIDADHALNLDANLLYWLRMDDVTGTTVNDVLGNNDGSLIDTATQSNGVIGKAIDFDGSGDYIDISDADNLDENLKDGFTISMWYKSDDANSRGTSSFMFSKFYGGIGERGYIGSIDYPTTDAFIFTLNPTVCLDTPVVLTGTWTTHNVWTHLAIVYDGSDLYLYHQGEVDDSVSYSGGVCNSDINLRIGKHHAGTADFNGRIDDWKVFDRGLSPDEIKEVYELGVIDAETSFTKAYYTDYITSRSGFFNYLHILSELNVGGDLNVTGDMVVGGDIDVVGVYKVDGAPGITDDDSYWLCEDENCNSTCQVNIMGGIIVGCY